MKWLTFCLQTKVLIKSLTSKNMPETHLIIIQCNICFASFMILLVVIFLSVCCGIFWPWVTFRKFQSCTILWKHGALESQSRGPPVSGRVIHQSLVLIDFYVIAVFKSTVSFFFFYLVRWKVLFSFILDIITQIWAKCYIVYQLNLYNTKRAAGKEAHYGIT